MVITDRALELLGAISALAGGRLRVPGQKLAFARLKPRARPASLVARYPRLDLD